MQTQEMAELHQAIGTRVGSGFEACGSPFEVANGVSALYSSLDQHRFISQRVKNTDMLELDYPINRRTSNEMLWTNVVLKSTDQLRQRVAWSLSQIIIIGEEGASPETEESTELWGIWYDIFVRHAFGNYRDILKEVSYSPMMRCVPVLQTPLIQSALSSSTQFWALAAELWMCQGRKPSPLRTLCKAERQVHRNETHGSL